MIESYHSSTYLKEHDLNDLIVLDKHELTNLRVVWVNPRAARLHVIKHALISLAFFFIGVAAAYSVLSILF